MTDARPTVLALRQALLAGRNADGGWGYYPGKGTRLEPTCWALLALADLDASPLVTWPSAGNLLRERPAGEVNFAFHALGLLTLAARGVEHQAGNAALTAALEAAKGIRVEQTAINRQNNQLQGWSWIDGTFSWVEPTAWALLALRKRQVIGQRLDAQRLTEAEALLVDRCCQAGGWNYGNANMLGQELRPYVPTTAIALLALQGRELDAVVKSVAYLERAAASESSSMALSLAALALAAHRRPVEATRTLLLRQSGRTLALQQQLGIAMALYALEHDSANALTL